LVSVINGNDLDQNGELSADEYISSSLQTISYNYTSYSYYRGLKNYELTNHLGNVLVVVSDRKINQCNSGVFIKASAIVVSATDYSPFGAPLAGRTFQSSGYRYRFNGQEQDNEIAGTGNIMTAEFWEYDSRLGRRWNVDPAFQLKPWITVYHAMGNCPILKNDPTGALEGEYEKNSEGEFKKVSNKGDEIGVDFYHFDHQSSDGKVKSQTTWVTDRKGNWNVIKNGRSAIKGEVRTNDVDWQDIYNEWSEGTGPSHSYFEGNNEINFRIMDNYLFKDAYEEFKTDDKNKGAYDVDFYYLIDNIGASNNMQAQMMGSYNVSFYALGERTLSLIQDSKSRTSFYYHLPVRNHERDELVYNPIYGKSVLKCNKQANTYQTYIFLK